MKIIHENPAPCLCNIKRDQFLAQRQQSGFADLGVGSVVECDCGAQYMLSEDVGTRVWIPSVTMEEIKRA